MKQTTRVITAGMAAVGMLIGGVAAASPALAATTKSYTYTSAAACASAKYSGSYRIVSLCVPAVVFPGVTVGYVTKVEYR